MNAIEFKKFDITQITASALAELINKPNPAYLAMVDDKMLLIQADGENTDGNSGDESGLPAERLAIRKIVVFASADDKGTKVPVTISYRAIGEMNESMAFRLIGNLSSRLVENATETGKSMLQNKIDVEQDATCTVVVFRKNGGGRYKVELATDYFTLDKLTAIDAATGKDATKHQLVIAGNKDGSPTIERFSPHTGSKIGASAQISLPKGSTEVKSVAIDRKTLAIAAIVAFGKNTKGFANANGVSEISEVKDLDGAESIRMTKTGLYAYDKKGEVKYFQRKGEGIDLDKSDIVLSGIDTAAFRLHDIYVEDDSVTGRTKRTATFTARDQSTTGARSWTTQALAA